MSETKAGTYVLAASVFYRVEDGVRRRYKRGEEVELSATEAARLTVAGVRTPAAFVYTSSDEGKAAEERGGDDLAAAPEATVNREDQASQLVVEANTAGALAEGQAVPAAGDGDGPPAKAATVDAWRDYAVKVGAVDEDEAGEMTKAQLQEAVGRKSAS